MKQTKTFTAGKWSQSHREGKDGMYNTQVYDSEGETICTLAWHAVNEGNGVTSTDREENAVLISHAPDMYKLLNELTNGTNSRKEFIHFLGNADNLISKINKGLGGKAK